MVMQPFSFFNSTYVKLNIRNVAHFKRTAQLINRTKTYYVKRLMRNNYFDGLNIFCLLFLFFLDFGRLYNILRAR